MSICIVAMTFLLNANLYHILSNGDSMCLPCICVE